MKFFGKLIGLITHTWWVFWSNIRWSQSTRENIGITEDLQFNSIAELKKVLSKFYSNYKWTADGIDELWDCITPPPHNYKRWCEKTLLDDCDGFHSLVYHMLYNNNYKCYLLTAIAKGGGHCVSLFLDNKKKWRVIDYTKVYTAFDTPEEAIEDYNKNYSKIYSTGEVYYNGLLEYSYEDKKFKMVHISKLTK